MTNYQRERAALGQRLRELRLDARLTGRALAHVNRWHPSKVSRLEAGKQTPSDDDLTAWATACDAQDQLPTLIASLRSYESHYLEFRRIFRSGMTPRQQNYADTEAGTDELRNFENTCVPGLLQTAEYARHRLLRSATYTRARDDIDDAVAARMQRQQTLYRPEHTFHFVITEPVLRLRLCPLDTLLGQLDRLISVASAGNVHLGVIPADAEYPAAAPLHGFAIYDDRIVRVENFAADLELTRPDEIDLYRQVFADLAQAAAYGRNARSLIMNAITELTPDA